MKNESKKKQNKQYHSFFIECQSPCANCTGSLSSNCLSCLPSFALSLTTCISETNCFSNSGYVDNGVCKSMSIF